MLYHLRDIVGKKRTDKILLCKNKKKLKKERIQSGSIQLICF